MTTAPVVVTLGETMGLLSTTTPGPLAHASTMELGIGGSESNVATGLSRLGVRAVWIGRVGDDSIGRLVEREIRAEGIDTRIVVDETAPTGLMIKERRTSTAQHVEYYRAGSAGSRLSPSDLDPSVLQGANLLHLTGITPALSASAAATVDHAARLAHEAGVPVSIDLNYRSKLWTSEEASAWYREFLGSCDLVFAGEDEAALVIGGAATGDDDPAELAAGLAAFGPREVVVKCGGDGAVALVDGVLHRRLAVPIVPLDTVGAGDAFVAGYLAEAALELPVEARLTTAVTTGAFVCLSPGDWEGLPRRSELALLGARDPVTR